VRERWRLLVHAPADGAWNMAVDEALLESCLALPRAAPTLRLYAFVPSALSLGKSQPVSDVREPRRLSDLGVDLVRRPTGGRAVLHERERTYAVVGRLDRPPFGGGVLATYRVIAEALELGLRDAGVDARATEPSPRTPAASARSAAACFGTLSTHEISVRGRKLVGSAQLRRGGAFLQHGSLPWQLDASRLAQLLGEGVDPDRLVDLDRAARPALTPERLDRALVSGFSRRFDADLAPGELSAEEALLATRLRAWKHLSAAWTLEARSSSAR
jgi:lipoate-protein ligase A